MNDESKDSPCSKAEAAWLGAASGAKFGAVTGALCGVPLGLLAYIIGVIFTCPVYGVIGAVLGMVTGPVVGACCAANRSVLPGWLVGSALSLALGLIVLGFCWFSVEDPVPLDGPINAAAPIEQQVEDTRRYLEQQQEWAESERGAGGFLFALPVALCCFMATLGAAWRMERLHPEWD